jgi:hypothetical protein
MINWKTLENIKPLHVFAIKLDDGGTGILFTHTQELYHDLQTQLINENRAFRAFTCSEIFAPQD